MGTAEISLLSLTFSLIFSRADQESMDAFSFYNSYGSTQSRWSYDSLKNFRQISPPVQAHLKKVYLTLCCTLVASAAGAYLHFLLNIGGMLTTIACFGSILWLFSTPFHQEKKKLSLLMAAATFEGASLGPLFNLANAVDPSILVTAFVGTALAFGCFSAAAMLARRREYLYLGGLLSSGLSVLLWLHFASAIFGGSTAIFKFELYFGLLLFIGFIVVDTQDIIEKAHSGDMDYVNHAMLLFTDFIAVFVRVLVIMLKNSIEKGEKKKKRRD